jgi:RAB protein geranylgeranyltransferase component A
MELDHPPFDAIILGCGLSETIASACVPLTLPSALSSAADALLPLLGCSSLAHAGKTVLHVDEESYYGSDYASLSLIELVEWAQARKTPEPDEAGPSTYLCNQRRRHADLEWSFPASSSPANGPLPDDLRKASRDYSLSLAPLLIPSVSPLIDTLVASGVSRYSTFRLLESTSIYVPAASDDVGGT